MLFGMIRSGHDNFCRSAAVHRIMHFVLDGGEEVLGCFAVQRVIHGGCIDICDFLIEAAFAGANLLNFRDQVIEIGFVKNLTVGQTILVQHISLFRKGFQNLCCPLPELHRP